MENTNSESHLISIFTPTYNRAYILSRLFKSLVHQTYKSFEWIIVDDGSTDNTDSLINQFIACANFTIKYVKQKNLGKHIAINKGVDIANGELFFIVDSDDWLYPNALEVVNHQYNFIEKDNTFAGVCGLKVYENGLKVGGENNYDILNCNSLDFRYKYKIKGDVAEVFKTKILRNFKFPCNEEKFCPESLVWNRIACKYKLRYFYQKIYICEYLDDGLTAKIFKIRKNSPNNACQYYSELSNYNISLFERIKAVSNYWRFAKFTSHTFYDKIKNVSPALTILSFPLLIIITIRDLNNNASN